MTASRLAGKELSTTQWVDVQANWLGVNLVDPTGSFLAPIEWVGSVGLINWVMRFPAVPSSGTSGVFKVTAPDLAAFPDQYLGYFIRSAGMTSALLQTGGVISSTLTLTTNSQVALRGMLAANALNY